MCTDSVGREIAQLLDGSLFELNQPGEGQVCVSSWFGSGRVALGTFAPRILRMLRGFSTVPLS